MTSPRKQLQAATVLAAVMLLWLLPSVVNAQGEWEMKVCADPNDYPASSQERPGFENRIAEILADQLNANLSYQWVRLDRNAVRYELQRGTCDMIFGVTEGTTGVSNTVSYYRAPYVFIYPTDAQFDVESLNDEGLANLTLTTFPNSLLHEALAEYGLDQNMLLLPPARFNQPGRPSAALVQAVLEGEADVALAYGPDVAEIVARNSDRLTMKPVTPQIVPPLLQMFRIVTIGVRSGDEALRDRLNIALASRWDEIQAVFEEYGVPVQEVPRPRVPALHQENVARLGAVLPLPTGNPAITDAAGLAAQMGSLIAEDLTAIADSPQGIAVDVLFSSAPTVEAARRAAERMVAVEDVTALLGGLGEGHAELLNEVAARANALFLNVADASTSLRNEKCQETSFHIEASYAMYLDGILTLLGRDGRTALFVVYSNDQQGEDLLGLTKTLVGGSEVTIVGSAAVESGGFMYQNALDSIAERQPEAVLALLSPVDQELFLSQYGASNHAPAIGLPHPVTQTRAFLTRLRQVAPDQSSSYRLATWDTTLENDGAGELNERFVSRAAQPMDPTGWNAYAATTILHQALNRAGGTDSKALISYLESPAAVFDIHKGRSLRFRPWNHQLAQPLYRIEIDQEAAWNQNVSARVALATAVGQVPSPDEPLEGFGLTPEQSECSFQ